VSDGPGFGSPNVLFMPTPRVAMLWDEPTDRGSAGSARFILERQFGYPVTPIRTRRIADAALDGFDVIIVPGEGRSYMSTLRKAGADNLKDWVARGGVLVALGSGTRLLADPDVDLLPIRLEDGAFGVEEGEVEKKSGKEGKEDGAGDGRVPGTMLATEADLDKAMLPDQEPPRVIAGVLAEAVTADPEHWLAAGVSPKLNVLVTGNDIYSPARQNAADTVARFAGPDALLKAGVLWEGSGKQLAFKPFVVSRKHGRGLAIGFTADPNFRAHLAGLNLLFVNAVFRSVATVYDANRMRRADESSESR
jgi:putative intracellular protease/amidase